MNALAIRRTGVAGLVLLAGIALAIALAATTGAFDSRNTPAVSGLPLAAQLREPVYISDLGYTPKRWVTVAPSRTAFAAPMAIDAFRWTGAAWRRHTRPAGTWVYAWPYTDDWSWTWTQADGWMAMRDSELIAEYRPVAVAT